MYLTRHIRNANTPESFIQANAESHNESALESGIDNRINTIKNSNEEEH